MPNEILLYAASVMAAAWGVAHLFATRSVVAGFGEITQDNRRIITVEWIVEGVALISVGAFVAVATAIERDSTVASGTYAVSICTLVVLAAVSLFTGAKIDFLPFRLCPFIFGVAAVLIALGAWL